MDRKYYIKARVGVICDPGCGRDFYIGCIAQICNENYIRVFIPFSPTAWKLVTINKNDIIDYEGLLIGYSQDFINEFDYWTRFYQLDAVPNNSWEE